MTVNHDPSVLRSLPARLDHRPHFDQPRACDQISSRDHDIELNMNQQPYYDQDIDYTPAFQISNQRADYDRLHTTINLIFLQRPDLDPTSNGRISSQRPDSNLNLTRLRPDRNAIADPPNHRHQLRARSRSTR
ncbi:MAG: hypothetical protein ACK2UC_08300 [Anaerolineae bacterium]|jgi:hypothetical protein